uniref:Uncharacterized protein n=1 Tax=Hordeum vulgare subsp. vulgare TaxID=112509 RepID=A0A8I6Z1L4_HORVV
MRMRGYGANDFLYDVRYEPYIARLGLLPLCVAIQANPTTGEPCSGHHIYGSLEARDTFFHLGCGEMTITPEDMAMISGLPINGFTLTSHVSVVNSRDRVGFLIGVHPPPPLPRKAGSSKVKHSWLKEVIGANNPCPADADEMVVQ